MQISKQKTNHFVSSLAKLLSLVPMITLLDTGLKGKFDEVVSLGPEIAEPFVATKDISYVDERYVMQTNSDAQIRVVSTCNLQLHAITFIQQTGGLNITDW
ncbi:MAG: hypothetical protein EZS28_044216 [Streblomastix strix]|uniref:Uncharacterized protein n=1 Tax=Streblomastix strix TaxID=222440 RepID=A0A5J4TPX3_9EUKA|nr:MAG: hypothetical protein EZS28_044216 [Streblomastix strix]